MIKHSQLLSDLKRGKLLPLYLLYGEEEFLIQQCVGQIIQQAIEPAARDFNFTTSYCKETAAGELVNLCQTLPFMAERRLVIAKDIDAYKAADLDALVAYLKDPSPSTCLVMLSAQRKYDKKTVVSAVEAAGAVAAFYPLLDREVPGWIETWAAERKLAVSRDASQYIHQIIGSDLQKISNELEKVRIYIKDKKSIAYDDVKSVVGDFREFSTFDLAEAIGRKNREQAFLVLSRLIQEGEQPVGILGAIAWNFRRLLKAKAMEAAGAGYDEIKKKIGVIFHQSAAFHDQMRSYTLNELRDAFGILTRTDKTLKSSSLSGRLVLERMILKLCGH